MTTPKDLAPRAWLHDEKKMVEVDFISYLSEYIEYGGDNFISHRVFSDITLLQPTGLRDEDGKMIFEGDICRDSGGEFVVEYHDKGTFKLQWVAQYKSTGFPVALTNTWNQEVIGNVHENPELLEGK